MDNAIASALQGLTKSQRESAWRGLCRILGRKREIDPLTAVVELSAIITRIFSIRLPQRVDAICAHAISKGDDFVLEEVVRLYYVYRPKWVFINGDNDTGTGIRDDKGVVHSTGQGVWTGANAWKEWLVKKGGVPTHKIVLAGPGKFTHDEVREFRISTRGLGCENVIAVTSAIQFVRTVFTYTSPQATEPPFFWYAPAPCGAWDNLVYDSLGKKQVLPNELIVDNIIKLLHYAEEYPHGIETWEEIGAYLNELDKHVNM